MNQDDDKPTGLARRMSPEPAHQASRMRSQLDSSKSLLVAYVLWFFLGGFGAHLFYLRRPNAAWKRLALTAAGWATVGILIGYIPLLIVGFLSVMDAFELPAWMRALKANGE